MKNKLPELANMGEPIATKYVESEDAMFEDLTMRVKNSGAFLDMVGGSTKAMMLSPFECAYYIMDGRPYDPLCPDAMYVCTRKPNGSLGMGVISRGEEIVKRADKLVDTYGYDYCNNRPKTSVAA